MKKYVINISASTEWAAAVAVLIYSLKINLKIYNECDIKVQYNNLSDNAKHLIKKVDSNIIFEKPKNSNFHKTMKQSIYGNKGHDVLLCFEAFWQDKYERSLYLDADMLCVNDFSEILTKNNKIIKHIFFGHQHITSSGSYCGITFSSPRSTWSPLIPNFSNEYRLGTANTDTNYNVAIIRSDALIIHTEDFLKTEVNWFK